METLDDLLKWNMRGLALCNWCNVIGALAGLGLIGMMV